MDDRGELLPKVLSPSLVAVLATAVSRAEVNPEVHRRQDDPSPMDDTRGGFNRKLEYEPWGLA
jgi:hypothetical protein